MNKMQFFKLSFLLTVLCCTSAAIAVDTPYSDAVTSLTPTYYYRLDETDPDGPVVDSMGNADPGEFKGEYETVEDGFAQAGCAGPLFTNEGQDGDAEFFYIEQEVPGVGGTGNLAHCSNNVGHIDIGPSVDFGANAMTVSMFFRYFDQESEPQPSGDRLFTNNLTDPDVAFQLNVAGQGMVVAVNPSATGETAERTLGTFEGVFDNAVRNEEYGWFHVVAATSGVGAERADNIQVWVNGENRTDELRISDVGWGTNTSTAKIGGRRDDPADSTTHAGAQDEVAIWLDRVLTDAEVTSLWTAATTDFVGCESNQGDLDGNGTVEFADFLTLSSNFGMPGGAADGDTDCDGEIGFADFLTLSSNFGQVVGGAQAQSVPEPSTAAGLIAGICVLGMVRRRRN